ncbi:MULTISPECIES: DUF4180 domain-containing protein [unclassified Rhizobium]|jgi:hypothetical protein|uniref:DUF4180 domain-containing protein n=1 Tax=unclassified Rhizobium TaxID=2613769 RepID=UPI0006456752|nr:MULTISPECIES: DUF4180 domain-containing protein [unclassified Rhizobium]MBN8949752.1 DUF4180 domain-containing protein [Rhizobium tropici]OJY62850.1 MAG: alpha/beta hydrolase [Rhizobium sp. 60-20]RKD74912.1 uncharacterized protein DUF4180 [Rhizobium sp. WW_1]
MYKVQDISGHKLVIGDESGPILAGEGDVNDWISAAWDAEARFVVVPISRLNAEFFQLSTRIAGAIIQKFVNYRAQLVILGDISQWVAGSNALRDFVYESNKGREVWFLPDIDALAQRLQQSPQN